MKTVEDEAGAVRAVTVSNHCIVCQKGFNSSEAVQRHLLLEHVSKDKAKFKIIGY